MRKKKRRRRQKSSDCADTLVLKLMLTVFKFPLHVRNARWPMKIATKAYVADVDALRGAARYCRLSRVTEAKSDVLVWHPA